MQIKILDTIFFENKKLIMWVYTDLSYNLQVKDIAHLQIMDVVKAFLVNLKDKQNEPKPTKSTEVPQGTVFAQDLNNDDLNVMLSDEWIKRLKIVYAVDHKH